MKKKIATEFLWFLLTLILAIPLGFLFLWLLGFTSEAPNITENEKDYVLFLYLLGYTISFIGIYLIRLIVMAIKLLTDKEQSEWYVARIIDIHRKEN